jgi:predicted secreted Zn-dependent protease
MGSPGSGLMRAVAVGEGVKVRVYFVRGSGGRAAVEGWGQRGPKVGGGAVGR